jgi:hypothetical protein
MSDPPSPSAMEEGGVLESVVGLRLSCWYKRMILLEKAGHREQWQRTLHLASGIIMLISGGSVAALLATIGGGASLKLIGAVVAFLSGVLSLVVTTYFDPRETQKMFEGASNYGLLRDRLDTLRDELPTISYGIALERLQTIRADAGKASSQYDSLMPRRKRLVAELRALEAMQRASPAYKYISAID